MPRTVAPVRLVRRLVPDPARLLDVVVLLRVVRRVVAGRAQQLREHRHPVRQAHPAPHVVRPEGRRIHPGDDCGAGGRAHRCVRPRVQVDAAALGQSIQIRRVGVRVTVGPQGRPVVLAAQPQDVRPLLRLRGSDPGDDSSSQHHRRQDCPLAQDCLHPAGRDRDPWPSAGIGRGRRHSTAPEINLRTRVDGRGQPDRWREGDGPAAPETRPAMASAWAVRGPGRAATGANQPIARDRREPVRDASAPFLVSGITAWRVSFSPRVTARPRSSIVPCAHASGVAWRKPSWALSKPPPTRGDARC